MHRPRLAVAAISLLLLLPLTACGGADATAPSPDEPVASPGGAAGMCAPETPDCVDTVVDERDDAVNRMRAEELLGAAEADLTEDVRVARRGDEQFMLTEDYVVGRLTVELDEDTEGSFRVVSVTLELPDGPEVITE